MILVGITKSIDNIERLNNFILSDECLKRCFGSPSCAKRCQKINEIPRFNYSQFITYARSNPASTDKYIFRFFQRYLPTLKKKERKILSKFEARRQLCTEPALELKERCEE